MMILFVIDNANNKALVLFRARLAGLWTPSGTELPHIIMHGLHLGWMRNGKNCRQ